MSEKNAIGKMAPIDLLDRVATNIHFVKNAIFAKHNKMKKLGTHKKWGMPVLCIVEYPTNDV